MTTEKRPFPGIDLLRFLCAFSVLCCHYSKLYGAGQNFPPEPFRAVLGLLFDHGAFAVQIFWAISGFIFFWKYADVLLKRTMGTADFIVLRLSRLYPLHLATLLIVAGLQLAYKHFHSGQAYVYHYNDLSHFMLQLLFVSYWAQGAEKSFNAPIWSISLELLAYAVFFMCASSIRLNRLRNSAVTAVIFALIWSGRTLLYVEFAGCLMLFFAGGLVYTMVREAAASNLSSGRRVWFKVLRIFCAFNVLAPMANFAMDNRLAEFYLREYVDDYCYLLIAPSVLFLFASMPIPAGKPGRIAETLGNLTYSSYLIHFPLLLLLVLCLDAAGVPRIIVWNHAGFLTFIGVTFALSHWVYHCYERPMQKLIRHRLLERSSRTPPGAANPDPALLDQSTEQRA